MKFSEWINQQDIELARWEYVEGPEPGDVFASHSHHHELVPYTPEETDIIIERYLRNVRKIYGDMPAAGDHLCIFNCPYPHPDVSKEAAEIARKRLEDIRKNKPL
jgi:hypothetical protein